jgi:hypothetical protein
MLVIDGKYNSEDGRIRRIKSLGDSKVKAQEEQRRGERAQQSSRYRSSQRRRKTKIESRWISFRNPVSRQIGQEKHEVYHREKPR